jgi:hypothetical protein
MNSKGKIVSFLVILGIIVLLSDVAMAAIIFGGSERIEDRGWPSGCLEMANLASRFGWWEGPPLGGGEYHFLYRCENTSEFNQTLEKFAAIEAKGLELVVHNGPKKDVFVDGQVDWTFTVWTPESWMKRLEPVPPPGIDLYIGGGSVVWEKVEVPESVVLIDKRPGSVSPEFAGKGLIRAEVFDIETRKAIPAAQIVLLKPEAAAEYRQTERGKTDKKGFCQIAQIPLGYYEIRVLADGYVARKWGGWDNDLPDFLQFKIGLARPACVVGIVIDTDGKPIEGAKVWATDVLGADGFGYSCVGDPNSTADAQGRFEMCSLPKGSMSPRCRFEGLHFTNSILDQHKVPSDGIRLVMIRTATIWGKVVDRKGNKPTGETILELEAEGVRKPGTWYYGSHGFDVDPNGTFNISGIPPGRYVVTTRPNPRPTEYEPNTGKITVEAGKTYEIEILHEDQRDRAMNVIRKFLERKLKDER